MNETQIKSIIDQRVKELLPQYLQGNAFTQRKLTDTPTDNLQVVNRKYTNLYGTTAQRPVSSVIGQRYFDTSLATNGQIVVWNGTGWVKPDGSYA